MRSRHWPQLLLILPPLRVIESTRDMVELRLEQASNDIPADLRREIENLLHNIAIS
jgi:hypothetical protein